MKDEVNSSDRLGWFPGIATVLAIVTCYGTLLVVGTLSLLGVTLVVNQDAWAGAISVFAVLAVVGVALGYRRHHVIGPLVIAAIGAVIILWVMFGVYSRALEVAGFAGLVIAAIWDWRMQRRATGMDTIQRRELAGR